MGLQGGAQLIFQCERSDGTFDCLGFTGVPIVNPILLVLCSAGTPQAKSNLALLNGELLARLQTLFPKLKSVPLPCQGVIYSPDECHALQEPYCQKVLVIAGDKSVPLSMRPYYNAWLNGERAHLRPLIMLASAASRLRPLHTTTVNWRRAEACEKAVAGWF